MERTKENLEKEVKIFKVLTLTSPNNPTGLIYDMDFLEGIAKWCIDHRIHLIVNEIYALSLIQTGRSEIRNDYKDNIVFNSFANLIGKYNSEFLHMWWAVSKDFGASGFRLGVGYSKNKTFIKAEKASSAIRSEVSSFVIVFWGVELLPQSNSFLWKWNRYPSATVFLGNRTITLAQQFFGEVEPLL